MKRVHVFSPNRYGAAELAKLPPLRDPADAQGLVLSIPATGLTVAVLHPKEGGTWMTRVVAGMHRGAIPGSKLLIAGDVIAAAPVADLDPAKVSAAASPAPALNTDRLLAHATEFSFTPSDAEPGDKEADYFRVQVQYRGPGSWAVTHMGMCWGPDGWDPEPSERTASYLKRHRFPLDEAVAIARLLPDHLSVNGHTWTGWQEVFEARREAARNEGLAG